jgi:NhaA family Na+:H+ antiporter
MSISKSPTLSTPVGPNDHILGPLDAKMVIVEYGDYECSHCRLVHENMKQLREYMGDEVCHVYRHLPITSTHPHANLAAEAAEAAAAQGKFWEMHNRLFELGPINETRVLSYAAEIGLDMERFQLDLSEHTYADRVQEDFHSA